GGGPGVTLLSPEQLGALVRDAECIAKNFHPNIARIKHIDATEADVTIGSEFVDGSTLADLFAITAARGQRFPLDVLVRVLLDVLTGLHALHGFRDASGASINAVHGELCPGNIVVGRDGIARIVNAL